MTSLGILVAGEVLQLFADRAAFWKRAATLLVADTHFGKASAFRHAGIPVPEHVTTTDLQRLSNLLSLTNAERLLVLGDLFHAKTGRSETTMASFQSWREHHRELQMVLLKGNHDIATGPLPAEWNIEVIETLREAPFFFAHEQCPVKNGYGLFGHVHPAIRVGGGRTACFQFGPKGGLLPAFGSFTGTHPITPVCKDRIFALQSNEIFEVPKALLQKL